MTDRRSGAGRPGGLQTLRQLITLVGALDKEGVSLDASVVARRLSLSYDEAQRLLSLLFGTYDNEYRYILPFEEPSDDFDELTLADDTPIAGGFRLTRTETLALLAALGELGISQDDPLAQKLVFSLGTPEASEECLAKSSETITLEERHSVMTCAHALAEGKLLRFAYKKPKLPEETRSCLPQRLRHQYGHYYLDGVDLGKQAQRTYRADRMFAVQEYESADTSFSFKPEEDRQRSIVIHFDDPSFLELFDWLPLLITKEKKGTLTVHVWRYDDAWLIRHLAACGGHAWVEDEQLSNRVKDYAHSRLGSVSKKETDPSAARARD